jgi:hypothetical protein
VAEQTLVWQEKDLWLRSCLDWLTNDHRLIIDLKPQQLAPSRWPGCAPCWAMGMICKRSWVMCGIKALSKNGAHCQFVALGGRAEPPYASSFVGLSPQFLEMSEQIRAGDSAPERCTLTNC